MLKIIKTPSKALVPLITGFMLLTALQSIALSKEAAIIDPTARFHPVYSQSGMVVSQEIIASQIGADILSQGGNAIDAAVATGFALAVTLPRAGNLAGGGFMMIHLAEENKTIALDYREMAPAAASRDMFLDGQGDVDNQLARFSIKSSGVPGTVAGLLHAHEQYGSLSLLKVLNPAIKIAKNGIKVTVDLSSSLASRAERLGKNKASKGYFYKSDGALYQPGDTLKQADLATSLARIRAGGRAGFYDGKTADLIVSEMQRSGGLISRADLKNYKVVTRQPVCGDYRDNIVCAMPPPSSGGVHLVQMLNVLEGWDLKALGHNSAAYIHRLVEVMRRAYADRSAYLGDPDYYAVPVGQIIDKKYAASLRADIDLSKASVSSAIEPGLDIDIDSLSKRREAASKESVETTHFSTWDQWGNVVSSTTTLNFSYGSGISVVGAGFLLNNEMDDFSAKPDTPNGFGLIGGIANSIEPGKRPLSSMTPTIVFGEDGKPMLATGSPGGSTIITVVLQTILNVLSFDMGIAEASSVSRIHHQWLPDQVFFESGISKDTLQLLTSMGHQIGKKPRILGSTQSIQRGQNNSTLGASDPRRQGSGAVAQDRPNQQ
jgi:gamma-glutamyltranspeptidase/glutathione hydrolase